MIENCFYDLYARNGLCFLIKDGIFIVDIFAIKKASKNFQRKQYERIQFVPINNFEIKVEGIHNLLNIFLKHIKHSKGYFFTEYYTFQELGRQIEEEQELYRIPEDITEYKDIHYKGSFEFPRRIFDINKQFFQEFP